MFVALLWVASPTSELYNGLGSVDSASTRAMDSSKLVSRTRTLVDGRLRRHQLNCSFSSSIKVEKQKRAKFLVCSSLVANPTGEMAMSSAQKVYDVVLKQATLVNERLRSKSDLDVKPDIALPGTRSLLIEAYDRCGEVCAEYAKTFYLVWCRRKDGLVDEQMLRT